MRVFVAGATGAIGRQLVPRLVAAGHEVTGMTRSESKQVMPSLSTSGETLTIEELLTLRARTETAGNVGDEHEWSGSRRRG